MNTIDDIIERCKADIAHYEAQWVRYSNLYSKLAKKYKNAHPLFERQYEVLLKQAWQRVLDNMRAKSYTTGCLLEWEKSKMWQDIAESRAAYRKTFWGRFYAWFEL